MKVMNLSGTGEKSCECGTWLQHWEKVTGNRTPVLCSVEGCYSVPEVGAHVKKYGILGMIDSRSFIVPICKGHNNQVGVPLEVRFAPMAHANVDETCGNALLNFLNGRGFPAPYQRR